MQADKRNTASSNESMFAKSPPTSRRSFIIGVGKKAAYITPIVMTLTAAPAVASPHAASCKPTGQPCTRNPSCCSNVCGNARSRSL